MSKYVSFIDLTLQAIKMVEKKGMSTFSPNELYPYVLKISGIKDRPKEQVTHKIRQSLDALKNRGEIRHHSYGKWEIVNK